jgi:hypothetical protein
MSRRDTCGACGCDGKCGREDDYAERRVRAWLDRQHTKPGGIDPEARAAVEQLADDLEAGDF